VTVDELWTALGAQLAGLPAPALVVVDGEAEITTLAQDLWPGTPIQRCWWHLPHGLRKTFYVDDAANRHVNPRWARHNSEQLGEVLRDAIRAELTTDEALVCFGAFTETIPSKLTSAHGYLDTAREHTLTCLDPALRTRLVRLGGPELDIGVLERRMRELGRPHRHRRGPLVHPRAARPAHSAHRTTPAHPAWKEIRRTTHRPNKIHSACRSSTLDD